MDDKALVEQFQAGATEAFGQLYDRYIRKIYDFIYFRTSHKETAEDLTSVTFTKALENLQSFSTEKGTFQSWIYRIARNTVIDYYRTKKSHDDIDEHFEIKADEDIAEAVNTRLLAERIEQKLSTLSEEQRELVTLRIYEGLSFKEIAHIIGKSEGACKMALSRAITMLQNQMLVVICGAIALAIQHL